MPDTTNIWERRIEQALAWNPPENKRKYLASVLPFVRLNPQIYPTPAQRAVLEKIYEHLEKRNRPAIEAEILAVCGMPT